MTATVTTLPIPDRKAYVVHHRTGTEVITRIGWGRNHSEALADSGLPSGMVHVARFSACDACQRALAAKAVSR